MQKNDEGELPPAYDPKGAENTWYPVWEKAGYFTPDLQAKGDAYTIVIPPPNVTGSLHMGHALSYTLEDILTRWRRMQGKKTLWVPGTDHAGIATQMVVERKLRTEQKKSRHDLGREKFLEEVWKWKAQYGDRIVEQLRTMGCSVDWKRFKFTMDPELSRSVREAFVRLHDEKLIYRAERLVNWCPSCHTALSDLEVEHDDPATAPKGELWSFAYPLADGTGELVVATTRPETMLGDTAVAVHPDDPRYKKLIGKKLKHPLLGYEIPVIADAILVDMELGTGAVKVTPAHDFNDFATGKRNSLALFNIFDADARIVREPEVAQPIRGQIDMKAWAQWAGVDRMEARKRVKAELEAKGLARGSEERAIPLGRCQRCRTVVEPSLSVQWWVKTEPLAKPALEAVRTGEVRIIPDTWTKTYFHWMENIQDWCISRQLWWGHRIPAWYCTSCDKPRPNGTYAPTAQPIVAREAPAKCPRCGGSALTQDADVLDTWFSSGLWPFSTLGWPDETPDLKTFYPNSVMETGFDILFFWVARMMMMGIHFMGKPPFPVIYLHAMVRDKNGEKMSKTRGNVIDPLHLINGSKPDEVNAQFRGEYPEGFPSFGADALRFTLAALSQSGRDIKLSVERIEGYRNFANKIWNAARFVMMRLEGATPPPLEKVKANLAPADRYILSRLARTVNDVDTALEGFRFADAASSIYAFIWGELCDWYIELVKGRLTGDDAREKDAARATLVFVLDRSLRMLHPFMPFISEEIWQKLPLSDRAALPKSVMVAPFPKPSDVAAWADAAAETEYGLVQNAIVGVRTIRAESGIGPSKPVTATFASPVAGDRKILEAHGEEIRQLARLSEMKVAETAPEARPGDGAKVFERVTVLVHGAIDPGEARTRLERDLAKAKTEIDRITAKLGNEGFVSRAPPEVVAKERARKDELAAMITEMNERLAAFRS
jgi:valyl-tRNA synthetase